MPVIFDIQRFSLHDGEGIRTLVFLKGCPLQCLWCSNPESQEFRQELMYDPQRCEDFGDCISAAPDAVSRRNGQGLAIKREKISSPEKFAGVCVSGALSVCGQSLSTEDLLKEICKDQSFFGDSGGVTLSGGEPLSRHGEILPLLRELKLRGISVNVETSLHVRWAHVQACMGWIDQFLVDLKHTDPLKFTSFTGGDAGLVLDNLARLTEAGARVIVRIPVIPGFNHSLPEMKALLNHAASLEGVKEVHFLPYHALGEKKYRMLGRAYPFSQHRTVNAEELEPYMAYAASKGLKAKSGG